MRCWLQQQAALQFFQPSPSLSLSFSFLCSFGEFKKHVHDVHHGLMVRIHHHSLELLIGVQQNAYVVNTVNLEAFEPQ